MQIAWAMQQEYVFIAVLPICVRALSGCTKITQIIAFTLIIKKASFFYIRLGYRIMKRKSVVTRSRGCFTWQHSPTLFLVAAISYKRETAWHSLSFEACPITKMKLLLIFASVLAHAMFSTSVNILSLLFIVFMKH